MVWHDMIRYGMIRYGMVGYSMILYSMIRYSMVWYGMVWYSIGFLVFLVLPAGPWPEYPIKVDASFYVQEPSALSNPLVLGSINADFRGKYRGLCLEYHKSGSKIQFYILGHLFLEEKYILK